MTAESLKRKLVSRVGKFHDHPPPREGAFTLMDALTVLAIVALLGCLMLPALARTTTQTKIAQCEANLKQDVLAMLQFGTDNSGLLPTVEFGANWPWDMSAVAERAIEPYGLHRTQLYDPGFPTQNIDQLWNYSTTYNSQGVPTGGYRATGYTYVLSGDTRVPPDDYNTSLAAQILQVNGSDPQLTQTIPAVNGLIKINPARRVLVCDALTTYAGQTNPTQYQNYTWNLHTDVGEPGVGSWNNTPYGPWRGAGTPHLNSQFLPTGGNEGMLDGHVEWVPFSGMSVHSTGTGDCFWWQSDPAKL